MHILIWRLATEPDLISIVLASDTTNQNQIRAFTKNADVNGDAIPVVVNAQEGNVWVSNQSITHAAETLDVGFHIPMPNVQRAKFTYSGKTPSR